MYIPVKMKSPKDIHIKPDIRRSVRVHVDIILARTLVQITMLLVPPWFHVDTMPLKRLDGITVKPVCLIEVLIPLKRPPPI